MFDGKMDWRLVLCIIFGGHYTNVQMMELEEDELASLPALREAQRNQAHQSCALV